MFDADRTAIPDYATRTIPMPGETQPLSFETAQSIRHRARLSGMNPNHWYPAEWSDRVKSGGHVATRFWSAPIALFRTEAGAIGAIEDRCPHRHLPLSMGKVVGCNLVCMYHGWAFDGAGELQSVEHDTFGRGLPPARVRRYPVQERYGLIWIFPGDPAIADQVPLPEIPFAEGNGNWTHFGFDFTWKAHHSIIIDNLCNLTHLYTHDKWVPYERTWLIHRRLTGEDIELVWRHTFRSGPMTPLYRMFLLQSPGASVAETHSTYRYPYHVSHQGGACAVNLMLPLSMDETRVFTLYFWRTVGPQFLPQAARAALMERLLVPLFRPSTVEVYRQDGVTVEAEMANLDRHFFAPTPEINPAISLFDRLNSERWQAWLDYRNARSGGRAGPEAPKSLSGLIDHGLDDHACGERSEVEEQPAAAHG